MSKRSFQPLRQNNSRAGILEELARIVGRGEGAHLEFKRRVPTALRISKEVVAFANTDGGRILLGVDDAGQIVGLKDSEEEVFALRNALELHCDPKVEIDIVKLPVSRKREVIDVRVPPSSSRPHFVVDGAHRTAYVRVGENSVEASKEAVRLMRVERKEADVRFEFGEKELMLMRYLDRYGRVTVEEFAKLAGIPKKRASHTLVLLTRAGVLSFHQGASADHFTAPVSGEDAPRS